MALAYKIPKKSAHDIADYFIKIHHDCGDWITNLKLQKLLYYAQAWYLALYNEPLFEEEIQAWIHGPVVPSVYARFKPFGFKPIDYHQNIELPSNIKTHLDEIMKVYGPLSAYELEQMTHEAEPWLKARGSLPIHELSCKIIYHDDMKKYYKKIAEEK